jgi:hypothetical protein
MSVTPGAATHSTPSRTYIKPPEVVQYCRAVDPAEHVERLAIRRARHGVVAAGCGPLRMHARRSVRARDDLLPRLRPRRGATQHNHASYLCHIMSVGRGMDTKCTNNERVACARR